MLPQVALCSVRGTLGVSPIFLRGSSWQASTRTAVTGGATLPQGAVGGLRRFYSVLRLRRFSMSVMEQRPRPHLPPSSVHGSFEISRNPPSARGRTASQRGLGHEAHDPPVQVVDLDPVNVLVAWLGTCFEDSRSYDTMHRYSSFFGNGYQRP